MTFFGTTRSDNDVAPAKLLEANGALGRERGAGLMRHELHTWAGPEGDVPLLQPLRESLLFRRPELEDPTAGVLVHHLAAENPVRACFAMQKSCLAARYGADRDAHVPQELHLHHLAQALRPSKFPDAMPKPFYLRDREPHPQPAAEVLVLDEAQVIGLAKGSGRGSSPTTLTASSARHRRGEEGVDDIHEEATPQFSQSFAATSADDFWGASAAAQDCTGGGITSAASSAPSCCCATNSNRRQLHIAGVTAPA
eukprot:CAMPEP_0170261340 /NCGR_PEP_ID=MMETSP0116_2-20130129/30550_1 /TAXON_ID=400756 /ORGANISM="Durinskia baltica, Strain CSIRO CS-38" /LENGTH=253 /DNA_ID=CAMNT_0010512403 /DNA_START=239 /DNA_END=1001 /DNA_ORIENTATION=+